MIVSNDDGSKSMVSLLNPTQAVQVQQPQPQPQTQEQTQQQIQSFSPSLQQQQQQQQQQSTERGGLKRSVPVTESSVDASGQSASSVVAVMLPQPPPPPPPPSKMRRRPPLLDQKKNARIAEVKLGAGRRGISNIVRFSAEKLLKIEVFPGMSEEKITRSDGKFVIIRPNEQFFVFPIVKSSLPDNEQKVWAVVSGEAFQVHWGQIRDRVYLDHPLIYQVKVTATGNARWDAQKKGTRRKESDPMATCYESFFPKGDPVWIEDCLFLDFDPQATAQQQQQQQQQQQNHQQMAIASVGGVPQTLDEVPITLTATATEAETETAVAAAAITTVATDPPPPIPPIPPPSYLVDNQIRAQEDVGSSINIISNVTRDSGNGDSMMKTHTSIEENVSKQPQIQEGNEHSF